MAEIIDQPEGAMWHFLKEDRELSHEDGRLVVVGETLRVDVKPKRLKSGLHACPRLLDAVSYAPGPILCLVTLGGEIDRAEDDNKVAAQERTVLWLYDASRLLREFVCDVAEIALLAERAAGREPDPRSFAIISVMRRFMEGNATESDRLAARLAARSAARSAADSAAPSAARSAAWSAAGSAAGSAEWSAVKSAAWSAAWSVAGSAVWSVVVSAEKSAFNDRITQMALMVRANGLGEFAPPEVSQNAN
jgi:hypothetical protein